MALCTPYEDQGRHIETVEVTDVLEFDNALGEPHLESDLDCESMGGCTC